MPYAVAECSDTATHIVGRGDRPVAPTDNAISDAKVKYMLAQK